MKTAIITGGGGGIGLALGRQLLKRGFKVYAFTLHAPADQNINFIQCDVSSAESVARAFEEFFKTETQIDILVNNAGIGISGAIEFTPEADFKKQFDVNFFGTVNCTQGVIAKMREQRFGKIAFISSVGGVFALPYQTFYSASKSAMQSFADGLSIETKPFKTQVCTFLLGDTKSGFTKARRKTEAGSEIYGGRIDKSIAKMERDEQKGMSPDIVAARIARTLVKKRIPPVKTIGFVYKIFTFLGKILPKKTILFLLRKMYG